MGTLRMRFFGWACACLWLLPCIPAEALAPHLAIARSHVGRCEQGGNNRGAHPARALAAVKLPEGHPWCAAEVSLCLEEGGATDPAVRSARARAFIDRKAIPARRVLMGLDSVEAGDILIWRKGNTPYGHIGFAAADWQGSAGPSIEGNTSCGSTGSVRDGDCVCRKWRAIEPFKYFRITHIRKVSYAE